MVALLTPAARADRLDAVDATLVRAVPLPAAMTLVGRWNWWAPAVLRRRQPVPEAAPGPL